MKPASMVDINRYTSTVAEQNQGETISAEEEVVVVTEACRSSVSLDN